MLSAKKHQKSKAIANQQGFTLVEFMIASVLGLIVIGATGALYSHTRSLDDAAKDRIAVRQSLRTAGTMIVRDARMAGTFGCTALGRWNGIDTDDGTVAVENNGTPFDANTSDIADLSTHLPNAATLSEASAGVRWIPAGSSTILDKIRGGIELKNKSGNDMGALVFYYGEGGLGIKSKTPTSPITFVGGDYELDSNKVVGTTINNNGVLVAASCNNLVFQKGVTNKKEPAIEVNTTGKYKVAKEQDSLSFLLMAYKVNAYFVGQKPDGEFSLFRVELDDDGTWTPPQELVKNVTDMTVEYTFVEDCPPPDLNEVGSYGKTEDDPNPASFYVLETNQPAGSVVDTHAETVKNKQLGPTTINIWLKYDYANENTRFIDDGSGKGTSSNKIAADMTDNQYLITATLRGGNVCANRKLFKN